MGRSGGAGRFPGLPACFRFPSLKSGQINWEVLRPAKTRPLKCAAEAHGELLRLLFPPSFLPPSLFFFFLFYFAFLQLFFAPLEGQQPCVWTLAQPGAKKKKKSRNGEKTGLKEDTLKVESPLKEWGGEKERGREVGGKYLSIFVVSKL